MLEVMRIPKPAPTQDTEPPPGGDPGGLAFPITLAGLSGWVDATGFLHWRGLFVSFMSGNTTTLGVLISAARWGEALTPARVLLAFVGGVAVGELVGGSGVRQGRSLVLLLVAALLGAATLLTMHGPLPAASALLALGMGVQSAAIHRVGSANFAVTYVTGTLVNVGRGIADVVKGQTKWSQVAPYLMLWLGLLLGAAGGGFVASRSETIALSASAALAAGLAAVSWRKRPVSGGARA